jgi:hypothetical protein
MRAPQTRIQEGESMSSLFSRDGGLVLGGLLLGVCLMFSIGAAQQPQPRQYSVQYSGPLMMITDHTANRMYIYVNGADASVLHGSIDLTHTGEDKLLAEPPTVPDAAAQSLDERPTFPDSPE